MKKLEWSWFRIFAVVLVLGVSIIGVRRGSLSGRASGGTVADGCGGGETPRPQGRSATPVRTGKTTQALSGFMAPSLFKWNSCYDSTSGFCVEQFGTFPLTCAFGTDSAQINGEGGLILSPTYAAGSRCKDNCGVSDGCTGGCYNAWSAASFADFSSTFSCTVTTPTATNLSITEASGTLTARQTFVDAQWPVSGNYTWYSATDANGTNSTLLTAQGTIGYQTYPYSSSSDSGKYFKFCVQPYVQVNAEVTGPTSQETTGPTICSSWYSFDVPTATNVSFSYSGTSANPTAVGSYTYFDPAGKTESGTTYAWKLINSEMCPSCSLTSDSQTTQTLSLTTLAAYAPDMTLEFCVTPGNGTNTGTQTCTSLQGVGIPAATTPVETLANGKATATYSFSDFFTAQLEYNSPQVWYHVSDSLGSTPVAVQSTTGTAKAPASYTITSADLGFFLQFCVTPQDQTVTSASSSSVNSIGGATGTQMCAPPIPVGPTATNVATSLSGATYTGNYTFTDYISGMTQKGTTYQWYTGLDTTGANVTAISGATSTTYTTTTANDQLYLYFCVTPSDGTYSGPPACAAGVWSGPLASSISVSGNASAGSVLTGSFTYSGPAQSGTTYQWYASGSNTVLGTGTTLTLGAAQDVEFCVTPADGMTTGVQVCSNPVTDTTTAPAATNVAITISGNLATGTWTYSDANAYALASETFAIQAAIDSVGTGAATVTTGNALTLTSNLNQAYLRFCVTPTATKLVNGVASGTITGFQSCSGWSAVGQLASFFQNDNYGGNQLTLAYAQSSSGTCFNLSAYLFANTISSFNWSPTTSYSTQLVLYQGANCTGTSTTRGPLAVGAAENVPNISTTIGASWSGSIQSVRFVWDDTVVANNVTLVVSGNTATAAYVYTDSLGLAESGSTYTISRADNAAGTNPSVISTGTSWTLTTNDDEDWLQFCVTPANVTTTGTQVCSSWTSVGIELKLWTGDNYTGTNVDLAYQNASAGTCWNLSSYGISNPGSYKLQTVSGDSTGIKFYKSSGCGTVEYSAAGSGNGNTMVGPTLGGLTLGSVAVTY